MGSFANVDFELGVAVASDGESLSPPPKENWFKAYVDSWIRGYVELQVHFLVSMRPSIFKKND